MMERQPTTSPSQLDALSCRLAWFWGYKRGYRALRGNKNLLFGDAIHQALEAYYGKTGDPLKVFRRFWRKQIREVNPEWIEYIVELQKLEPLGKAMLEGYIEKYEGKEGFDIVEVDGKLITEHTLRKELVDPTTGEISPYALVSRLDGLVRDKKTGMLFTLEHKTYGRFTPEHLDYDHQVTSQVWLGQDLVTSLGIKEKVAGVIYNGLRKQMPTKRTTTPLFNRRTLYRNDDQIRVFLHRAFHSAREANAKDFAIYPSPNQVKCGYCDFRIPCLAYQEGKGYGAILRAEFTSRAERDSSRKI